MTSETFSTEPTVTREPLRVLAAAMTTVVLWASAFVGIRAAGVSLSPGALALGRLVVASVVLSIFVVVRREPFPARADLPRLALYAVLWFGVYNISLNWSETLIDAGTAAIIVSTAPILIAVFAGLFLNEGFPRQLLIGCAVAFVGAILIGVGTSTSARAAGIGAALCAVSAVAYAVAVITEKPLLERSSALMVTWLAALVGTVVCLPFAPQLIRELGTAKPSVIGWTAYLGMFPTALAFTTWGYALARSTAGRLGAMTYLVAPISVLLGWLILAQAPPWLALVGGVVAIGGVVVSNRKAKS